MRQCPDFTCISYQPCGGRLNKCSYQEDFDVSNGKILHSWIAKTDPFSCVQCCEYSRDYDEQIDWDLMPERVRESLPKFKWTQEAVST